MLAHVLKIPLRICRRLFRRKGRLNLSLSLAVVALAVLQMMVVIACSRIDGSWSLEDGIGLSQHLAAWVILITDPLLLLAGGLLYRQFMVAMSTLPASSAESRNHLRAVLRKWTPLICANGKYQYIYVACLFSGFVGWVFNVKHTIEPNTTYQHDVFDSFAHLPSFVAFKFVLFVSWAVVYPAVGYLFLSTAYATWRILRESKKRGLITPRVEHPDQSYGLRNVGTLNITILFPYMIVFASCYAIIETHKTWYPSIIVSTVGVFLLFIWTSWVVIRPVYSLLSTAQATAYDNLLKQMEIHPKDRGPSLRFALSRMHFTTATASPYSVGTKIALAAMQVATAVPLLLGFLGYGEMSEPQADKTNQQRQISEDATEF